MATEKGSSSRLKAICDELWSVKTELRSLGHLVQTMREEDGGEELMGLGLILERNAKILEDLIERGYSEKP